MCAYIIVLTVWKLIPIFHEFLVGKCPHLLDLLRGLHSILSGRSTVTIRRTVVPPFSIQSSGV